MSYRRALLFRWSTRDILAIVALAAIVAFLTGSALFYVAAADKPAEIAQEYQSTGQVTEFATVRAASNAAGANDIVLPFVELSNRAGVLVGIAPAELSRAARQGVSLPPVPDTGIGTASQVQSSEIRLRTGETTRTVTVSQLPENGVLPERWFVARPTVVETLGPSGAFVISPTATNGTALGESQVSHTVLRGTLSFFERGTAQVLTGFAIIVVAALVLGAVTIASVIRMTVQDRTRTIQVIRTTGATPLQITTVFALRGVLLTGAAVALGYALGVILSSLVTSIGVFAGLPTTLSPRVTPESVLILGAIYASFLCVGLVAGAVAVRPAICRPPGRLTAAVGTARSVLGRVRTRLPGLRWIDTELLDWRAVVPTVATVAVFTCLILLVTAGGTVAEPFATSGDTTIVEPDASHPVASTVPISYTYAFENRSASPEILVFGIVGGQPTLIRGGKFERFAAVSNASLVRGRTPTGSSEALAGLDFARTHNIEVGESILIGGGVTDTVERVRIVGLYRAPGAYDDQVLVSLDSARHLSTVRKGYVNFIRLEEDVRTPRSDTGVRVVSTSVDGTATTDRTRVTVTVINLNSTTQTRPLSIALGNQRVTERVTVPPGGRTNVSVQFAPDKPGIYTFTAGNLTRRLSVQDPDALRIQGLPARVPTNSAPRIRVMTVSGTPAENATITVGNRTYTTTAAGYARPDFLTVGTATVRATSRSATVTRSVEVRSNATRTVETGIRVTPEIVSLFVRPTARVTLYNPWNTTVTGDVVVRGSRLRERLSYQVPPGAVRERAVVLPRRPAGEYSIAALSNGTRVAETTFTVTGNERLSTVVIRNTETTVGGGLGAAISTVFGNLTLVGGALIVLASAMVAGALIASFARAIHAKRRTLGIYRATGAGPTTVLRIILCDTLLIGSVSVAFGVILGTLVMAALGRGNVLVFYGIRVVPTLSPISLAGIGMAALALVLIGAVVPTAAALRHAPADSFTPISRPSREADDD